MLETKLRKAAQAIVKNNGLLITSGSGMAADCRVDSKSYHGDRLPFFRGTYGLWSTFPVLRKKLTSFDDFVTEDFFKDEPSTFWYVWGEIYNRYRHAKPHQGYKQLSELIERAEKRDKYFIYNSGVDKFYKRSDCGFDEQRYVQAKGSLFDFQCKSCNKIERDVDVKNRAQTVQIDHIKGEAIKVPNCKNCGRVVRPNINMRSDLGWMEDETNEQIRRMDAFFHSKQIYRRSLTVIEIGAGPAQPLARSLGETFLKNDKYRCALIRINPIKERVSQYKDEAKYFRELVKRQRQQLLLQSTSLSAAAAARNEDGLNFSFRNKLNDDNRHLVLEEEREYATLRNELIEIQVGAEEGLTLLNEFVRQEVERTASRKNTYTTSE